MCGVQFDPDLHYLLYHSVLLRGTKLYVKYCIVTVLCIVNMFWRTPSVMSVI